MRADVHNRQALTYDTNCTRCTGGLLRSGILCRCTEECTSQPAGQSRCDEFGDDRRAHEQADWFDA